MKKTVLILSMMVLSVSTQAQWFSSKTIKGNGNVITKTRNTGDYDQVSVSGFFDVTLVKGQEGEIEVKAESNLMDYIITEVNGDELVIKLKKGTSLKTKKGIYIIVPFKDIDKLSLSGSGDVTNKDVISGDEFKVRLSGSGDIKLDLDVHEVTSKITGSGDIVLIGTTDELETSVTGSGDFVSKDLTAKDVEVSITGSGDVVVYASNEIDARVTGSGDVVFYGNPKIEKTKVIGSGEISAR
jgi:hypothetical protein